MALILLEAAEKAVVPKSSGRKVSHLGAVNKRPLSVCSPEVTSTATLALFCLSLTSFYLPRSSGTGNFCNLSFWWPIQIIACRICLLLLLQARINS